MQALFTDKPFTRSIEGSACVFLVAIAAILVYHNSFTTKQFIAALLAVPVVATLAEAKSPHTWDSPFIFAATGLVLVAIYMI